MNITPDWISSVGTVLAFGVTLAALLREMALRRRSERDDEVRQARLVLVTEPVVDKASVGNGPAGYVRVLNYSAEPIHGVVVCFASGPRLDEQFPRWVELLFLAPGEDQEFEFALNGAASGVSMESPQVTFLDSAGRRWNRAAGDCDPRRVFDYVPPGLEQVVAENLVSSSSDRRTIIGRLLGRIARTNGPGDGHATNLE